MSSRTPETEKYSAQDTEKWEPMEMRKNTWYGILPKGVKKKADHKYY